MGEFSSLIVLGEVEGKSMDQSKKAGKIFFILRCRGKKN
jgi:hypothetical protein